MMVHINILLACFIYLSSVKLLTIVHASNCTFGGVDLSKLDRFVEYIDTRFLVGGVYFHRSFKFGWPYRI